MILGICGLTILCFVAQGLYRNLGVYLGVRATYDALPPHLNTPAKVEAAFPDDSQYGDNWFGRLWKKFQKLSKPWSAFGPRSRFKWAAWKMPEDAIFKIGGKGPWRYEMVAPLYDDPLDQGQRILSRCQYYKRWSFVWISPLQFQFHAYWRASDVPTVNAKRPDSYGIRRLFFLYGPTHWDADYLCWILSFYLGGEWK